MRGTCGTKFTHGEFKTLAALSNMSGELNTILIPSASRLIGYACVSTDAQDLSLQLDALTRAGMPANSVFMDNLYRAQTERLGLRTHATPSLSTSGPAGRGFDHPGRWRRKSDSPTTEVPATAVSLTECSEQWFVQPTRLRVKQNSQRCPFSARHVSAK